MKGKKLLLLLILLLTLFSCSGKKVIKIGFISNLSGRHSELGIRGRDGLLMALDEFNNSKDSKKIQVELIIKDHEGDKNTCQKLTKELITQGVKVIIGPLTSGMAESVLTGVKGSDVLVVSPTVSTDKLTGLDDNFIRLISPSTTQGKSLGEIISYRKEKNVIVVADHSNKEYAESVILGLISSLNYEPETLYFENKASVNEIVNKVEDIKPDGIVFIASGIDTALIIQNINKVMSLPQLYGSSWVKLSDVASHGGKVINGMIITDNYKSKIISKKENDFNNIYEQRYNSSPNLPAIYTYESLMVVLKSIINDPDSTSLDIKEDIISTKKFNGVSEEIIIDEYGDAQRKQSLFLIENGVYELFETKE